MLEKEHVFLAKEGIQQEGFSNLWTKRIFYRDQALSPSLHSKGFDVNEEINNTMDSILEDKFDGYRCKFFDDATNDGTLKRTFFNL